MDSTFAVVSAVVAIITGVLMAMHPEWRAPGWAVIVACSGLMFWSLMRKAQATFPILADGPSLVRLLPFLAGGGGALVALIAGLIIERPEGSPKTTEESVLQLRFYGDQRWPTEDFRRNIEDWTTYRSARENVTFKSAKGPDLYTAKVGETWAIFLVFEKQTNYREVRLNFDQPDFPQYNIINRSQRSLSIAVDGPIPAGLLRIQTVP